MKFGLVLADPPWNTHTPSAKWVAQAATRYQQMKYKDLLALGEFIVPLLEDNAYLALWVSKEYSVRSTELAAAWGFKHYQTKMYWTKTSITQPLRPTPLMGQALMAATEELHIFKRGAPALVRTGACDTHWGQRGASGAKPDYFYEFFESEYKIERKADPARGKPERYTEVSRWPVSRLELFARTHREWLPSETNRPAALARLRYPREGWTQVGDQFSPGEEMPAGEDIRISLKKLLAGE